MAPRKQYSDEFKRDVIRLQETSGKSMRHDLSHCYPKHCFQPAHEARLKCLAVDFGELVSKRVVRLYPALQLEKPPKPRLFCSATVSTPTQLFAPHNTAHTAMMRMSISFVGHRRMGSRGIDQQLIGGKDITEILDRLWSGI